MNNRRIPKRTLIFADSLNRWETLKSNIDWNKPDTWIVTQDIRVAADCERLGLQFLELWDFLNPKKINSNRKTGKRLVREWYLPFAGDIQYRGIALADVIKNDMLYAFLLGLNMYTAFRSVIDRINPQEITLCSNFNRPAYWGIGEPSDVLSAVAAWMAETQGISIKIISAPIESRVITPAQATYTSSPQQKLTRENFDTIDDFRRDTKRILVLSGGPDLRNIRRLINMLQKAGIEVIIVNKTGNTSLRSIGREINYNSLSASPFDLSHLNLHVKEARDYFFERIKEDYSGEYPFIFGNSYFHFQFEFFFEQLLQAARHIEITNLLIDFVQPHLVITDFDALGIVKAQILAARSRNIQTIQYVHSGIVANDFHNFSSHFLFTWGKTQKEDYLTLGYLPYRLRIVGNFNFPEKPVFSPTAHLSQSSSKKKQVLVVTAFSPAQLATVHINLRKHRETWEHIIDYFSKRPQYILIIKPHPRYDISDYYLSLIQGKNKNQRIQLAQATSNLWFLIQQSDIVLVVNEATSAAIDAIFLRKPLIYLRTARYETNTYLNPLDRAEIAHIDKLPDLEPILDHLLSNPSAILEVMKHEQKFLDNFVAARGENAVKLAKTEIELIMASWQADAIGSTEPGNWPSEVNHLLVSVVRRYLASKEATVKRVLLEECARLFSDIINEGKGSASWLVVWIFAWMDLMEERESKEDAAIAFLVDLEKYVDRKAKSMISPVIADLHRIQAWKAYREKIRRKQVWHTWQAVRYNWSLAYKDKGLLKRLFQR